MKKNSSHTHKTWSWFPLIKVLFRIFNEHPCSFYMRVPPRGLQCTSISPMRWPERCYVFAWVVSSSWNLDKLRHCGPIGVFTFYCVIKITGISIEASEDKTMSPKLPPRCMTPGVSISCILRLRPASLQCILLIKARPNDRNISTQRNSTLFAQHLQAPAKRSQYLNATNSNIVDRNMLHAFGHLVLWRRAATCWVLEIELD